MTVGRITHPAGPAARVATGRISPGTSISNSTSKARRLLFGMAPDPAETKRYCDENSRSEQQRCIEKFGFDPTACRHVNASPLSSSATSSSSSGGSSAGAAAASQMRHQPIHNHRLHRQQ